MTTIGATVVATTIKGWKVHQLDIKIISLNGDLEEEVYVIQPPCFVMKGATTKVCKLLKALNGLMQAPQKWNAKIHAHLLQLGFVNKQPKALFMFERMEKNYYFLCFMLMI